VHITNGFEFLGYKIRKGKGLEDEVGSAEGAIVASRLIPHWNMWRDLAIHQRPEQPDRALNTIAY